MSGAKIRQLLSGSPGLASFIISTCSICNYILAANLPLIDLGDIVDKGGLVIWVVRVPSDICSLNCIGRMNDIETGLVNNRIAKLTHAAHGRIHILQMSCILDSDRSIRNIHTVKEGINGSNAILLCSVKVRRNRICHLIHKRLRNHSRRQSDSHILTGCKLREEICEMTSLHRDIVHIEIQNRMTRCIVCREVLILFSITIKLLLRSVVREYMTFFICLTTAYSSRKNGK